MPDTTLRQLVKQSYENSKAHGFHDDPEQESVPLKLALIHSEVSEILEEHRRGAPILYHGSIGPAGVRDPQLIRRHNFKPEGLGPEIADAVIRLADLCGQLGIDLEAMVSLKHAYNVTRPRKHGKRY